MKKKLKIIIPLALLILGAGYKMVLAKPAEPVSKVHGEVYVLPKEFLINLSDGQFAKLSVGLILEHGALGEAGGGGHGPKPPEGYGPLPQEGLVRDIITDTITGADADALVDEKGRKRLKKRLLKSIHKKTDVHAEEVLFTDVAVQ